MVILLSIDEREELEAWQRSTLISAAFAHRGKMVLLRARGLSITDIASVVDDQRCVVYKWLNRFTTLRIAGLSDKAGRGRKPFFPSGRGSTSRQACVREARHGGSQSVSVGLRRAGPRTGSKRDRHKHLHTDGAPDSQPSQAEALAAPHVDDAKEAL